MSGDSRAYTDLDLLTYKLKALCRWAQSKTQLSDQVLIEKLRAMADTIESRK